MPTKRRKKRYHIKPVPVIVLLAVLAGLIVLAAVLLTKPDDGNPVPAGDSTPAASDSSSPPSSETASPGPVSSESASSEEVSSYETLSSEDASPTGGEPTEPSSPSSAPADPPSSTGSVYQPKGSFRVDSYDLTTLPAGSLSDWNLILLNPAEANKIDTDLDFDMTQFDTQWVDSRAAAAYQSMYDAAKAAGSTLYLRSGYRSMATQNVNYNNAVQSYLDQGLSQEEAVRRTNQYYTVPGHSEHHSGLAFDIITPEYHNYPHSLDARFADTAAYAWLREHCWDYGFILRYPKEKEDVTHISFEPWHYRYVGVEHAKYIRDNGLCFEEYIQLLQAAER